MGLKIILSLIFILFAISLLILYWFIPFKISKFDATPAISNFSLNNEDLENMQFYPNMRFPTTKISYRIESCPLQKQNDMQLAFDIISDLTVLDFYSINYNENIFVTCDSRNKMEGDSFIAGEGGPTNITKTNRFNVIFNGRILLIKDSNCETPNVAIHELLHVLGFGHSENVNNIMYEISKCGQTIGSDIPEKINELYSTPSYSDLSFENVSALIHGRYLDTNFSVRNHGLKSSEKTKVMIYADGKLVDELDLDPIGIGQGIAMRTKNNWISILNVEELEFFINSSFDELEKNNNRIILEIKK